jgi:hypothetical protein
MIPSSIRTTRSANSLRRPSCVTMTTARARSCARLRIISMTLRPVRESSAAVGSSASTISGSPASARAMATRCFCPPLRSAGKELYFSPNATCSSSSAARRLALAPRTPLRSSIISMFSPAVRVGNRLKPWNTKPMCFRRSGGSCFSPSLVTSIPAMRTLPELARRMQPMMESSVVLPLPEGPISSTISPGWTSMSTPRKAGTPAAPSS